MLQNFDVFKDETNNCFQLRTKTNSYALEFDDQEKETIFLKIVATIKEDPSLSLKKLKTKLSKGHSEPKVIDVLKILDEYELLSYMMAFELKNQDPPKVDLQNQSNRKELSSSDLSIIGKGELAQALLQTAKKQTFKNSSLYLYKDINDENDIESIITKTDFLIVDGNEWAPYYLELINKISLKHNKPWLYVPGLEGISMKVGPLFYGKETGCYNCLISRVKSNYDYPSFLDSYEQYLKSERKTSKPDILPNSDLIYYLIANLALLEVTKFFQWWSLPVTWKTLLSIDVTNLNTTKHTLLKKPFCEVCKPSLEYNPAPWLELVTLK